MSAEWRGISTAMDVLSNGCSHMNCPLSARCVSLIDVETLSVI